MHENMDLFRVASAMARHAGTRQAVVAQNIANADSPGYKARDVTPFADMMSAEVGAFRARATRPGHLHGGQGVLTPEIQERATAHGSPNENQVSLEEEMLKAVEVKRQHDRGLAIYRSALNILRSSLGRG